VIKPLSITYISVKVITNQHFNFKKKLKMLFLNKFKDLNKTMGQRLCAFTSYKEIFNKCIFYSKYNYSMKNYSTIKNSKTNGMFKRTKFRQIFILELIAKIIINNFNEFNSDLSLSKIFSNKNKIDSLNDLDLKGMNSGITLLKYIVPFLKYGKKNALSFEKALYYVLIYIFVSGQNSISNLKKDHAVARRIGKLILEGVNLTQFLKEQMLYESEEVGQELDLLLKNKAGRQQMLHILGVLFINSIIVVLINNNYIKVDENNILKFEDKLLNLIKNLDVLKNNSMGTKNAINHEQIMQDFIKGICTNNKHSYRITATNSLYVNFKTSNIYNIVSDAIKEKLITTESSIQDKLSSSILTSNNT
jgi:hypothetical protein